MAREGRRDRPVGASGSGLAIRLLGQPGIEVPGGASYRMRSRKSWALLAFLLLAEGSPTRSRLAALLFAEAEDPLRALRWSLAEIRRCLRAGGSLDGDPVVLRLPEGTVVDVDVLSRGTWSEAVDVTGLGAELLEGLTVRGAPAFESWLLSERRRVAAATEAILHEAALGLMARGALERARGFAVRAAAMSPLDENHQALLLRLYRRSGDDAAAEQQHAAFTSLLRAELGVSPGSAVEDAMRERAPDPGGDATESSVVAVIEAGSAAIAAGAIEPGVTSLRSALRLADDAGTVGLRVQSRLALAEALIHSLGGLDEEGLANLHEADRLALDDGDRVAAAQARAELGYVDFLRARYDRAELWLTEALTMASGSPALLAKATTYLGSVTSDRGDYPRAIALLDEGVSRSRAVSDPRREAYALSMRGRVDLICGRLDEAASHLTAAVGLAEGDHWLSFLPWPQALLGEVHLAGGDLPLAASTLEQAFARACQMGDPCWEGMAARGRALVAEARGETDRAFAALHDARARGKRRADPYVWLDVYILDALCDLGRRHEHPETRSWVDAMQELASKTGMKELTVRAMLHSAALGGAGDAPAAAMLASGIENPALQARLRSPQRHADRAP